MCDLIVLDEVVILGHFDTAYEYAVVKLEKQLLSRELVQALFLVDF